MDLRMSVQRHPVRTLHKTGPGALGGETVVNTDHGTFANTRSGADDVVGLQVAKNPLEGASQRRRKKQSLQASHLGYSNGHGGSLVDDTKDLDHIAVLRLRNEFGQGANVLLTSSAWVEARRR